MNRTGGCLLPLGAFCVLGALAELRNARSMLNRLLTWLEVDRRAAEISQLCWLLLMLKGCGCMLSKGSLGPCTERKGRCNKLMGRSTTFPPSTSSEQSHADAVDSRSFAAISVNHPPIPDGPPHGDVRSSASNAFLNPSTGRAARRCKATCGQ